MSNFDENGVLPGLVTTDKEKKTTSMKCKDDRCPSKEVIELTPKASLNNAGVPHYRSYQCVKCKTTWTVSTGGFINL
jgi:hypothetical protein